MIFTVTYRAKDGAMREERVEAANRAECVAECRKRGIAPTGIKEGGKSRQDGGSPSQRRLTGTAAILAAVVLAAIAGGVWWWCGGREATALPAEAPAKPKVEKPKDAKPRTASVQPQGSEKPAGVETNASETAKAPAGGVASAGDTKKPSAAKPTWPPPPVQRDKNGRVIPPQGAITLDSQKSIFKHNSDTYIAMLVSPRVGEVLPPMPAPGPTMEEEFLASLKEPIEVSDDDTPEDRATKFAVAAARDEIKRLLDAGEKFADIVREHERLLKENNEVREKALEEYRELLKSGDEKGAERYFSTINAALQQMGVSPMEKPKSHEETRARMLEARARKQKEAGK